MSHEPNISPVLGYRDVDAAARWLCCAFGFEVRHVEREADGEPRFISLKLGSAFVIVSPAAELEPANLFVQPDEVNGANTQSCYLTVRDPDEHCARALAAGARLEFDPQGDYAGNRFYMCRDLEGHLWTFGTGAYGAPAETPEPEPRPEQRASPQFSVRSAVMVAAMSVALGALAAYGAYLYLPAVSPIGEARADIGVPRPALLGPLPGLRGQPVFASLEAGDTASQLIKEQETVAGLRESMRNLNAELWQLGAARRQADTALQTSSAQVQQISLLYDQAKGEAERARQLAAAAEGEKTAAQHQAETAVQASNARVEELSLLYDQTRAEAERARLTAAAAEAERTSTQHRADDALEASNAKVQELSLLYDQTRAEAERARQMAAASANDKKQVLANLEGQKVSAGDAVRTLGEALLAKDRAERSGAEAAALALKQRVLMNGYRDDLDTVNRRLADVLEFRKLLQRRMDQMSGALGDMEKQKTEAEQSAGQLKMQLVQQVEVNQSEHAELQDAKGALLTARRQIDELNLKTASLDAPAPVAAAKPPVSVSIGRVAPQAKVVRPAAVSVRPVAVAALSDPAPASDPASPAESAAPAAGVGPANEFNKCIGQVMGGKVDWGGGRAWNRIHAIALCKGTRAHQATLDCFSKQVGSGTAWQDAIVQCKDG